MDETIKLAESDVDFEIEVTAQDREDFKRLDIFLANRLKQFSRSTIKRLFEAEDISSPNSSLELKRMPAVGTKIEIDVSPPVESELTPENIPLNILFEDSHLIVINKPAGLVVHPAPGHYTGTLVNAILFHCGDLKGIGAEKRPGIVHRLDMGTSGVMVVAKDQPTHEGLAALFAIHQIERKYEAIVIGQPRQLTGTINTTIGRHPTNRLKMMADVKNGKKAITHYKILTKFTNFTHVELKLETGRTHQIRVHMSQVMHTPIACDPLYTSSDSHLRKMPEAIRNNVLEYPFQLLHAKELGFVHPITKEVLHFSAPPPEIFQSVILALSESK